MSEYQFQQDDYVIYRHGDTQESGKILQIDESKSQTMYYITKIFGEETTIRNCGKQNMRHLSEEELYTIKKYEEAGRYVHRLEQQMLDHEHYPEYRASYNADKLIEFRAFEGQYDHEIYYEKQNLRCSTLALSSVNCEVMLNTGNDELPWTVVPARRK
jgi:hypothetical protein